MTQLIKKTARRFGTEPDKVKHVLVSALLVLGFSLGLMIMGYGSDLAILFSLGITLLIGLGKEIADRFTGGDSSVADMTANVVGAVPMALLLWVIHAMI